MKEHHQIQSHTNALGGQGLHLTLQLGKMDIQNVSFMPAMLCQSRQESEFESLGFPRCPLPSLRNGEVSHGNREPGDVAAYSCRSNFRLIGPKERTCGQDGKWSGEEPVCEGSYITISITLRCVTVA